MIHHHNEHGVAADRNAHPLIFAGEPVGNLKKCLRHPIILQSAVLFLIVMKQALSELRKENPLSSSYAAGQVGRLWLGLTFLTQRRAPVSEKPKKSTIVYRFN